MKRWLAVISLLLALLVLLARCFGDRPDPEDLVDDVLEESREELERLSEIARNLKISEPTSAEVVYGEPVQMGDLVLTLEEPQQERRLWAAFLVLENTSEETAHLHPAQFIAVDDVGNEYEASWHIPTPIHRFTWGEVPPGKTNRGNVVFELAEGRTLSEVIYDGGLDPYEVTWRAVDPQAGEGE